MKKTYIEPTIMVTNIGTAKLICGSGDVTTSGLNDPIGYGGVDTEGEKDPASRRHNDVWAEEEEDLD